MLHIHFGAGRLGLGLVAPFLQASGSELYLLNRSTSAKKATGSTAVDPARRNDLLAHNPAKQYIISDPGGCNDVRETVTYDGFFPYNEGNIPLAMNEILERSKGKKDGVVVTASVLTLENYCPVVDALNVITQKKEAEPESIGDVYLVACENTVSAYEVLQDDGLAARSADTTHKHVRCVHALVDRMCVQLEECSVEGRPTLAVRAEEYGSLKLEICDNTEKLPELLKGSRVEFSRYLAVEKDIKGWLLNGSHWLIALTAFQETGGDSELKLNEFISGSEDHMAYAREVVTEMRDGIEALLRSDQKYAGFVRDVDVSAYLDGAADSILKRFQSNEDTITRILARFRAPAPDELTTVQKFIDRFLNRIEQPLLAYQQEKGVPAKSATQGIFNLFRLQASGIYVDTAAAKAPESKVA